MKKIKISGLSEFSSSTPKAVITVEENLEQYSLGCDWISRSTKVDLLSNQFYFLVDFNFDSNQQLRDEIVFHFREWLKSKPTPFMKFMREARKRKGWTYRKISEKTGLSVSFLSKIETGKKKEISEDSVLKIAEALEIPDDDLMFSAGIIPQDIRKKILSDPAIFKKIKIM